MQKRINVITISTALVSSLFFVSGCAHLAESERSVKHKTESHGSGSGQQIKAKHKPVHSAKNHRPESHDAESHSAKNRSAKMRKSLALKANSPSNTQDTKHENTLIKARDSATSAECSSGWREELKNPPTLETNGTQLTSALLAAPLEKCIGGKKVVLQSYLDRKLGYDQRAVGPAYVMRVTQERGAQFDLSFKNILGPRGEGYQCDDHHGDVSKCTNLHTHGFHVSPSDPADNVFLHLSPDDPTHQYRFKLPRIQAPGTHWLHAHLHGSTAPQLKNGMAGALILTGELDDRLAAEYGIGGDKVKIMLLQQLALPNDEGKEEPLCKDARGRVYKTSINGQCLPTMTARAGDAFHWRLIHAGISGTINLAISHPDGRPVRLMEYARDGITMNGAIGRDTIMLQPGYRSDVLFKVPQCPRNQYPCTFTVTDGATAANFSLYGVAEDAEPIARIHVTGLSDRDMRLPPKNWSQFKSPYPFIPDSELLVDRTTDQFVENKIWFASYDGKQTVNDVVFPEGSTTMLKLNTASLWKIWVGEKQRDDTISHPFHIHVNPFQVTDFDQNGRPFHYWKDTLLISGSDNKGEENAVIVRSRYETFDGEFVLHCHNLNHEDKGMMKKVRIEQ